jgi:hypothetical protein
MKKIVLLFFFLGIFSSTFADQLAYISKEDAEKAVEFIRKQKSIILFCGCCDNDKPIMIKPVNVYAKYTNFENFYEVVVEYKNKEGLISTTELDLAYTWYKKKKKIETVGQKLNLKHDFCKTFKASEIR